MSFLYPRTVEIRRQANNSVNGSGQQQLGLVGYAGREDAAAPSDPAGEVVLFTGIPAVVKLKRSGRTRNLQLPADTSDKPLWDITIPAAALAQYSIRDRDIIVDDENYRYMVIGNHWTPMGYQVETMRLEA